MTLASQKTGGKERRGLAGRWVGIPELWFYRTGQDRRKPRTTPVHQGFMERKVDKRRTTEGPRKAEGSKETQSIFLRSPPLLGSPRLIKFLPFLFPCLRSY